MNSIKDRPIFLLSVITVFTTLFFWIIFYFNLPRLIGFPAVNLETLFANYDGPNYLIASKCAYNFQCIATNFSLPQPPSYYPAHLPGFPLLISLLNSVFTGPQSLLIATLLGSIFLQITFYFLLKQFFSPKVSLILSLVYLFLPSRMLILRFVGAPETWFIGLTLASILLHLNRKYLLSAILAALAMLFKSPGILLFVAYFIIAFFDIQKTKKLNPNYLFYLLIPISALAIFYYYYLQTGDFLAYFHSGDNFHLNLLPYLVFVSNRSWINTIWLEDVIYIYLIAYIGLGRLIKKYQLNIITVYPLVFMLAGILVAHRDISRYLAPVYPFLIIAFGKYLSSKKFLFLLLLLIPAIILYSINFAIGNVSPVADLTPYL